MRILTASLLAALAATAALPAAAQSAGEWTLAVGAHAVDPKSNNGALADGTLPVSIDTSIRPTVAFEYFVADNIGIEVLAALPFQHDIDIAGLGTVGSTKHLPPTVSLQYHFTNASSVTPLLGVGLNYTTFFSEDTEGALAGSRLDLSDSWGLALHAGVDFQLSERSSIRIDARWIDISSDVKLDGAGLGSVDIDPWVYGAAWVIKF